MNYSKAGKRSKRLKPSWESYEKLRKMRRTVAEVTTVRRFLYFAALRLLVDDPMVDKRYAAKKIIFWGLTYLYPDAMLSFQSFIT